MSLSDNLRRLAQERVPATPAKWLGLITLTVNAVLRTRSEEYGGAAGVVLPTRATRAGIDCISAKKPGVCRFD